MTVILNGNNLDAALLPQLSLQTGSNFSIVVVSVCLVICRMYMSLRKFLFFFTYVYRTAL